MGCKNTPDNTASFHKSPSHAKTYQKVDTPPSVSSPSQSSSDIPEGVCDSLVKGSLGYKNLTGRKPNAYEKIGSSVKARGIFAEHWGSFKGPQVLIIGQTHGDECSPAFFVEQIRLKDPLNYGVWLIPTLNPDGLVKHSRKNANNVDLNRDGLVASQPETKALLSFTNKIKPVLSIHLHSPYAWVGFHNGELAFNLANEFSKAAGWNYPNNSGELSDSKRAFLWQGQAKSLPGHQSVLVELPAISVKEAAGAPQPDMAKYVSIDSARRLAVSLRGALDQIFSNK
jgi:hypothetical protein